MRGQNIIFHTACKPVRCYAADEDLLLKVDAQNKVPLHIAAGHRT